MAPKRKQKITVDDIGNSTSSFGENAEKFLNIRINETDSFDDIINHGISHKITYSNDDINPELIDILLEGFDRDAIRLYKPMQHKNLPKRAQTFLYKLNTVVNNTYQQVEPVHVEDYIHDLMDNVLREAKFEDGTELILMPCLLRLTIGEESFAAHAYKEGRRGTEIVWILDEDKHKYSDNSYTLSKPAFWRECMSECPSDKRWKRGDIQLIANMIAAAQTNQSVLGKAYPERILGIKFDADRLYFYSAYITEKYLNELLSMKSNSSVPLIVNKFPKTTRTHTVCVRVSCLYHSLKTEKKYFCTFLL